MMSAWFLALVYLGQLAALLARIVASGFKGPIKTMVVIEDPTRPLSLIELQTRLADTGALVVPGFTVTI